MIGLARVGAAVLLAAIAVSSVSAAETVPEPEGYRSAPYRAPVPATLKGAEVLTTDEAKALWESSRAVFVDVLPQPERPANLPEGTLWRPPERQDIPGSIWLANTGYDRLTSEAQDYLAAGLKGATDGRQDAALVFYCRSECWMSWNAAKRALTLGYANVSWYPEGTDGWEAAGLPLEAREPAPPAAD